MRTRNSRGTGCAQSCAADLDADHVVMIEIAGLEQRPDLQRARQDPRLEVQDGLAGSPRQVGQVERGRRLPDSAGNPKLTTERRTDGAFARSVSASSRVALKSHAEIPQDRLAHAALRQHPRFERFQLLVGLLVGQPIEQRRLQPFLRGTAQPWSARRSFASRGAVERDPRTSMQRLLGVGREDALAEAGCMSGASPPTRLPRQRIRPSPASEPG